MDKEHLKMGFIALMLFWALSPTSGRYEKEYKRYKRRKKRKRY